MAEAASTRSVIIYGIFLVIVAIISLIGGFFLKDPIQKAFKPHCKIGGVWKPHGGIVTHCDINQSKNKFYIKLQSSFTKTTWIVKGEGIMDGEEGSFNGTLLLIPENNTGQTPDDPHKEKISGLVSLQGCDGLGITLLNDDSTQLYTFAFIRESLEMKATPEVKD